MDKVTITEVAKLAKTSISTVSRVLAKNDRVNSAVKKRVEAAVVQLGYVPNTIARSLASKSSRLIGIAVTDLSSPYFVEIIDFIKERVADFGYTLFICDVNYNISQEKEIISRMLERRVDGIIIFNPNIENLDFFQNISKSLPVVSVHTVLDGVDSVCTMDYEGASLATAHLINMGHKKLAYIGYQKDIFCSRQRIAGFQDTLRRAGLADGVIFIEPFTMHGAYNMTLSLLEKQPQVTGLFCYNDQIAMEAYLATTKVGKKVGEDISIIGYDDIFQATMLTPELSTIAQPSSEIARAAVSLLLRRIQEEDAYPAQIVTLPVELITRQSVRKLSY